VKNYGRKSRKTPERYGTATVRATELERGAASQLLATARFEPFTKRVDLFITVFRGRKGDPDNICAKSEIDAFVALGILADDSSSFVRWVCMQERSAAENGGKEETIIEFEEIE
jgi:hypothetical protein